MTCQKRYLLDSIQEPHCMSCKKVWSLEFMNENFTQSFMKKEYRENRETIFFKEEETHFPAILPVAEHRKKIDDVDSQITAKKSEMKANDENEDQMVRDQRAIHRGLVDELDILMTRRRKLVSKDVSAEKREVVMKCPLGECRGFLDARFFCAMCDSQVCRDCHVKKDETEQKHECKKDDVATIQELNRSTKPCPKCHTRIFKTDGCDQMFCVQCHTPFSWKTGQVETGVIHNPHYFEQLRAGNIVHQRHQPHQGGCGAMRDALQVRRIAEKAFKKVPIDEEKRLNDEIFHYYQQLVHYRAVYLPRFTIVVDRTDERIKFLTGKLDEKKFKQRLYVHRQSLVRQIEEQQILDTCVNAGEDIFRLLTEGNAIVSVTQLRNLFELTCQAFKELDKKYQHKGLLPPSSIRLFF